MRTLTRIFAAAVYVAGSRRRLSRIDPQRLAGAGAAVMLLGAAWGLATIGLWEAAYRLTWPRLMNWVVPAGVCAAATVLVAWRAGFLALIETVPLPRPWLKWPALLLAGACWAAVLNYALRWWNPDWPTQQLSPGLIWLWPRALYRALLLAPMWGVWSMLVLPQFHRPGAGCDPHTRALAGSVSPLAAAAALAAPLAGTFIFLRFLPAPLRFLPPAAATAAAIGGGTLITRLRGGLCREALLATNALTQSAFLTAYLAVR